MIRTGLVLAAVVCCTSAVPFASADFFGMTRPTLTAVLDQAPLAILAERAPNVHVADPTQRPATTVLRVTEVLKGDQFKVGDQILIAALRTNDDQTLWYVTAKPSSAKRPPNNFAPVEVPCSDRTVAFEQDWAEVIAVNRPIAEYICTIPKQQANLSDRLDFYISHLEHAEREISEDAFSFIQKAGYTAIARSGVALPVNDLRRWVADDSVSFEHAALYRMLLAIGGNERDAKRFKAELESTPPSFVPGRNSVVAAYLLLTGPEGLAWIQRTKLTPRDTPFHETFASFQAVRDLRETIPAGAVRCHITNEMLHHAIRSLLHRQDMVDLVVHRLAKWSDWSVLDEVYQLFNAAGYESVTVKRSFVIYILTAARTEIDPPTTEQRERAEKYLAEIKKEDPKIVKEAERLVFRN